MAKRPKRGHGEGSKVVERRVNGRVVGYRAAFTHPAKGRRIWVSGKTKPETRANLREAMADAQRGILPAPANLTVGRYLESWLEDIRGTVRRSTYDGYRQMVRLHINPSLGGRKLRELNAADVRRLHRAVLDKGLSTRTINYAHSTLRKALGDAVNDDLLSRNVASGVRPLHNPDKEPVETKALSPEQVKRLLSAASEAGDRLEAFYILALHTGLRRGELLGLKWTDIDFERGTLSVRRSLDVDGTFNPPKKSASRRTLRLTPEALEALQAHRIRQNEERLKAGKRWKDNSLVFPSAKGTPMNAASLDRHHVQPLLKKAGLKDDGFTFHSLRHTFATTLAAKGKNPATVQKLLGHADIRMTLAIYTHADVEMQDDAIDAISDAFG